MSFHDPTDLELEAELEREAIVSADLGEKLPGLPCDLWDFVVTRSARVGSAALLGVYGKAVQNDLELIKRALANKLTPDEIEAIESKRPEGERERFGPNGKYGWAA